MSKKQLFASAFVCCSLFASAQNFSTVRLMPFAGPGTGTGAATCSSFAGTVSAGPFYGQSNDHNIQDTVFLCMGDTLHLLHNNDYDLSGDPAPITPAGVGFAFYHCPPQIQGVALSNLIMDNCLWTDENNFMYVAAGDDQPFFGVNFINNGALQHYFSNSQPLLLYLAPITLDDIANNAFESAVVGEEPGSCVHVNKNVAFPVVFLYGIKASEKAAGVDGNFCRGKFRLKNGLPEFDAQTVYTVSIALTNNPAVQGTVLTPAAQLLHGTEVLFEVPQAGDYTITVEDGKSCGLVFSMSLNACITVGTADLLGFNTSVEVTPNPFQDYLQISLGAPVTDAVFHLYDLMGREMTSAPVTAQTQELRVDGLESGVYFWQLEAAGVKVKGGKLMKY